MAIISCPECGKQVSDRAVSCPQCGCPISAAPVPAPAPVQNTADEVNKLLVLARRAREGSDSKNAKRYYEQILDKDPGNWEAMFYSVYFEASECKIMYISSAANSVANCLHGTFAAISDLSSESEQEEALNTVICSAYGIAKMLAAGALNHYSQFSTTDNAASEYGGRVTACSNIFVEIEHGLKNIFPDKKKILADFQYIYVSFLDNWSCVWNANDLKARLNEEIADFYPEHREKMAIEAKKAELSGKISSLTSQINSLVCTRKASAGCVAYFMLPVGLIMLILGLQLSSMDGESWPIFVAIPELIIGALCLRKTPPQNVVDENIKKRDALIQQRNAVQEELDAL